MIGIYKITNNINGKSYIGQSVDINRRFISHRNTAFNPLLSNYHLELYQDIRKYGINNFSFEVLEECNKSQLDEKEKFYIAKYKTHGIDGYNKSDGGKCSGHDIKITKNIALNIIKELKESQIDSETLGRKYGVTGRLIRDINYGKCWKQENENYPLRKPLYMIRPKKDNKCNICGTIIDRNATHCLDCSRILQRKIQNRPNLIELAKMICEIGFLQTGKIYGVSDNAIKKWCKQYGIPHTKKELKEWCSKNNICGVS